VRTVKALAQSVTAAAADAADQVGFGIGGRFGMTSERIIKISA
jgi:hypothetical protein